MRCAIYGAFNMLSQYYVSNCTTYSHFTVQIVDRATIVCDFQQQRTDKQCEYSPFTVMDRNELDKYCNIFIWKILIDFLLIVFFIADRINFTQRQQRLKLKIFPISCFEMYILDSQLFHCIARLIFLFLSTLLYSVNCDLL